MPSFGSPLLVASVLVVASNGSMAFAAPAVSTPSHLSVSFGASAGGPAPRPLRSEPTFVVGTLIDEADAGALGSDRTRPAIGSSLRASVSAMGADAAAGAQTPVQTAVEYSDAYRLRARIHRIASFTTLPLFGAEAIIGQSLYSSPSSTKKDLHLAMAGAIAGLFAVNSVTGVWNLLEARKDPNGRTKRWIHGILMLAADVGFLATALTAPEDEREHGGLGTQSSSRATHRAVAFSAIGAATAGYTIMLVGR